jgi:hypothetical protein
MDPLEEGRIQEIYSAINASPVEENFLDQPFTSLIARKREGLIIKFFSFYLQDYR